jgi:hypothetical protein
MTRNSDPRNDLSTPGDPKDNHEEQYTTAPERDRAATQDKGVGGIQELQDHQSGEGAQTFKGMNSLVTRDPDAFEHAPQEAAYAGAAATPSDLSASPEVLAQLSLGGGLGNTSAVPDSSLARDIDPNPAYTPPSEMSSPHPREGAADLGAGAPGEAGLADTINDSVSAQGNKR